MLSKKIIDSLIAAAVYSFNLTLVSGNEKDFINGDIPLLNPWKG